MALERISVKETATIKKMPELAHDGVEDFVRLSREADDLAGRLEQVKVDLKEVAVGYLLTVNRTAVKPVSSIRLYQTGTDGDERAEAVVSFQDKYTAADAAAADTVFSAVGVDVNEFMHEVPKVNFDSGIFIVDGKFNRKVFDTVNKAVIGAITKLVSAGQLAEGTTTPLSVTNVVVPRPNFHAERFKRFSPAQNRQLSSVVKNTVTIKAC